MNADKVRQFVIVPKNNPFKTVLVSPGKIGLALDVDTINGGASITAVDTTCRLIGQVDVGDIIVSIDGRTITSIDDFQMNADKVRQFVIVLNHKHGPRLDPPSSVVDGVSAAAAASTVTNSKVIEGEALAAAPGAAEITGFRPVQQQASELMSTNEGDADETKPSLLSRLTGTISELLGLSRHPPQGTECEHVLSPQLCPAPLGGGAGGEGGDNLVQTIPSQPHPPTTTPAGESTPTGANSTSTNKKAEEKDEEKDDAPSGGGGPMSIAAMTAAAAQKKAEVKAEEKDLDPTIMDLGHDKSSLDSQGTSDIEKVDDGPLLNEDPKYQKYFKMLKMGLPMGAVQNAMTRDGLDPAIMDLDHDKSVANQMKGDGDDVDDGPPLKEDPKYEKYFKMLKMGLPMGAVQNAMTRDGLDPAIMELDHDRSVASQMNVELVDKGPPLKEDPKYEKYFKMLKMGVPMGAVQNAMTRDGLDPAIMDLDHDKSEEYQKALSSQKVKKKKVVNRKTVPLHWEENKLASEQFKHTIFARSGTTNPKVNTEKLEKEFQRKESKTGLVKSRQSNAGNGMANVLDIASANNISIQLKAFNNFTLQGLAETINDLDPEGKIDGERIQLLSTILSHSKFQSNLQAIRDFNGDSDQLLNPAELFLQHLLPVERVEDKVEVMKVMHTFYEHANEARVAFKTLGEVCGQIMNSKKVVQVLLMVLDIGNLMNEGTVDGSVEAFKFESLEKLSQTKSADGKTTVLDYIVETFIERGDRKTLFLTSDFPDIQECCQLSIKDLCGDVNTLRKSLELCKEELGSMKKDQAPKATGSVQKKDNPGEAADPKTALFAAIKARGTTDGDSSSKPPYSPGVKKLESFLLGANETFSLTEKVQNDVIDLCKKFALYCGEDGGESSARKLLQFLASFASSLEAAVEKYDKMQKKESGPQKMMKAGKENQQVNVLSSKASSLRKPQVGLSDGNTGSVQNGGAETGRLRFN
ncbi:hypothetical protein ACHAWC_011671 [Mediolabrus comicus]